MSSPWFDHVWNAVGTSCSRECCALFALHRDLNILKRLPMGARVLVGPADLFGSHVPDEVVRDIFVLMARHPHLVFRVLTQNPYRMEQWFGSWAGNALQEWVFEMGESWPLANIELGVRVGDQEQADSYIGALVASPTASRFIVIDHMRSSIDLEGISCPAGCYSKDQTQSCSVCVKIEPPICKDGSYNALREGIDEVIITRIKLELGGFSKELLWREDIIEQCKTNKVRITLPTPPPLR